MAELVKKIRTASGDLQIDYNSLANLPALNTMFSNPNLLINSDFRNPVNQRGKSSYSNTANIYTIDRWKVSSNAATLTVKSGYIVFFSKNTSTTSLIQKTEVIPVDDYITVSISVKSITGTLKVYITSSTSQEEYFTISSSGIKKYTTSVHFTDFMQLKIEAVSGATSELYWAKVEQGSIATPFVSRIYAQELADCQRYYTQTDGMRLQVNHGTSHLYIAVPTPATLRVAPTVTFGATQIVVLHDDVGDGSTYTIGDCYSSITNTHVVLDISGSYGGSVYKTGHVASSFPIYMDAEIY